MTLLELTAQYVFAVHVTQCVLPFPCLNIIGTTSGTTTTAALSRCSFNLLITSVSLFLTLGVSLYFHAVCVCSFSVDPRY